MRDAGIGRVLVASLHQGIADTLPMRLAFYESWLKIEALRGGTIGLAPTLAVLSFLRQEGDAYDRITTRAGEYAAEWTVENLSFFRRSLIRALPMWLRIRVVLREARRLIGDSYHGGDAIFRVARGQARMEVRDSIFCQVREPVDHPLCGFYAAAVKRLMTLFAIEVAVEIEACRGTGAPACVLLIPVAVDARTAEEVRGT